MSGREDSDIAARQWRHDHRPREDYDRAWGHNDRTPHGDHGPAADDDRATAAGAHAIDRARLGGGGDEEQGDADDRGAGKR